MIAVILAGGKGTRLHPYTTVYPKPMLPIDEKPILEIIIKQLSYYGFKKIYISLGYLSDLIELYFKNNKHKFKDIEINYIKEKKALGTAGSISLLPDFSRPFLVMNGDVLTSLNFKNLYDYHINSNSILTIASNEKEVKIELGILEVDRYNKLKEYIEKPIYTFNDSMGIYIYSPEIKKYIPRDDYLDLPTLANNLIKKKKSVMVYNCNNESFWIDIGRHKEYEQANIEFKKKKKIFLPK